MEHAMRWIALDFDGKHWHIVAVWLVGAQAVLVSIALGVDWLFFSETPYGFFAAMLIFTGHVFLDASTVEIGRPLLWAAAVTLAPPVGAILYSRRRVEYRRLTAVQTGSPAAMRDDLSFEDVLGNNEDIHTNGVGTPSGSES